MNALYPLACFMGERLTPWEMEDGKSSNPYRSSSIRLRMKPKGPVMDENPRRSMMKPTSEAARRWAEVLRQEMERWPGVAVKRAFGMTLVYRGEVVFAALPGTRALYEEDAILIKFARETPALVKRLAAEKRFAAGTMQQRGSGRKKQGEGRKWRIYLLREERDSRDAVEWLARAYGLAR